MDMAGVIVPKSDQWNADDFIAGPMTVEITGVKIDGGTEQPVSISIAGTSKVYRPCKSMSRVLVAAWGADAKAYTGRSLTLYRDPKVKWGGMEVGGIRISHMSHIERELTLMLTMTKQNRAPHRVKVLDVKPAPVPEPSAPPVMSAADALAVARREAGKGSQHFRAWYNTDAGKASRASGALTPEAMLTLRDIATEADASIAADPFGLPPLGPTPTEAELAAAERAAREYSAAQQETAQ